MKITLYAHTDMVGSRTECTVIVDDEEWASMNEQERQAYMLDEFWNSGLVEWGYDEQTPT